MNFIPNDKNKFLKYVLWFLVRLLVFLPYMLHHSIILVEFLLHERVLVRFPLQY